METRIRNIVLGIAELQERDPHLAPAIRLADAHGAMLHVVHAFHLPDPALYPYPEMSIFRPEAIREIEEQMQSRLENRVRELSSNERIACRAVPVPAGLALVEVAREVDADLIVVGATRRGTLARTILGTTAQRVVRSARIPVLVNRRPDHGPLQRVLFTTDLSDHSARAYARGLELMEALGPEEDVELRALLVVGYDAPPMLPRQVLIDAAAPRLDQFLKSVDPDAPTSRGSIRVGDPAKEIGAEAVEWGADLIVVGTHGRTGPSRLLIGSVAEGVVRHALCDVLVIPGAASSDDGASPAEG